MICQKILYQGILLFSKSNHNDDSILNRVRALLSTRCYVKIYKSTLPTIFAKKVESSKDFVVVSCAFSVDLPVVSVCHNFRVYVPVSAKILPL